MVQTGGTAGRGVIFEYNYISDIISIKQSFNGVNGASPVGSLLLASNGDIYGETRYGGLFYYDVIFKLDKSNIILTKKFDFDGINCGYRPSAALTQSGNWLLYGVTTIGGANNNGVLFSYNPLSDVFSPLLNFPNYSSWKLFEARKGKLYGLSRIRRY